MADILAGEAARRSLHELWIALIAAGLTLASALGLYLGVPIAREALQARDAEIRHERKFEASPVGGRIVYTAPTGVPDRAARVARYRTDLELLSRRFGRGQFDITLLPGLKESPLVAAVARHQNAYRYSLSSDASSATLSIEAPPGPARTALQAYLKYLDDRWVTQR